MRRLLLLCALLLQAPAPCDAKTHLYTAVAPLAPWQWMRGGQAHGPDLEVLSILAQKLDFQPEWVPLASPADLAPLREGRAELVAGIADPAGAAAVLQCFKTPHRMQGVLHIYVRKGMVAQLQFQTDLGQFKIGLADGVRLPVVEGVAGARPMRGGLADLLPALTLGKLDAVVAEATTRERQRAVLPDSLAKAPLEIAPMPLFVCMAKAAPLVVRFEELEVIYQDLVD